MGDTSEVQSMLLQIYFRVSEENRRRWVASDEHQVAFPKAKELAEEFAWRGYDVAGEDS